jgi:sugar lactone lactonase YvrE
MRAAVPTARSGLWKPICPTRGWSWQADARAAAVYVPDVIMRHRHHHATMSWTEEIRTMADVNCVLDAKAELAECPVWAAQEQALYWVDIYAPALNRLDPATGENRSWPMPQSIGSFGLRESGGAVVALRDGFHLFDFDTGELSFLGGPRSPAPGTRFNDGKVSPDGRFFAGTMDEESLSRPIGALYRLDPDGGVHRVVEGLIVSNGLAWSADGRTMFHSDSKAETIWAYDYDPADGSVDNRRVLARATTEIGRPDGAATDVEGFYWSAGISAGVLNRWAPDGRLDRTIPLPCSSPTMPCFGGPDLTTIYVTSLRHDVAPGVLAAKPLSGGIFAVEVDVPGVPVARFKG